MYRLYLELNVCFHPGWTIEGRHKVLGEPTTPSIAKPNSCTRFDIVSEALLDILQSRVGHYIHCVNTVIDQDCLFYSLIDDQLLPDKIVVNLPEH